MPTERDQDPTDRDEERIRPEETEPGRPNPPPEERDLPDGGDPREEDWREPGPEKDPGPPETPGRKRREEP